MKILYAYPSSYAEFLLQVKLMSENEDILRMAAEQFLGKSVEDVQDTIIQVTSFFQYRIQIYNFNSDTYIYMAILTHRP